MVFNTSMREYGKMSKGSKVWKSETIKTRKHWAVGTVWNVTSSNGKDVYDIEMLDSGFTCDCPAFRKCKHIKQVEANF